MKKKFGLIVIIVLLGITSLGCKKESIIIEEEIILGNENKETEEVEVEVEEKKGISSPLSGIYSSNLKVNRRPIAIMFDNHPRARWQSGLKDAEIIYEFSVEGTYTRYLGIYLINDPEIVGPIRSSRPYFVDAVLEYDPVYVRVGGSEQAKSDIKSFKIADIDGLTSSKSLFWRESHKKAPNNMYSSMGKIRESQKERGYKSLGEYDSFKFREKESDIQGEKAEHITINYNDENTTLYEYDSYENIYKRSKDGKLHIDEIDESQITAKNIIIQEARTRVIDREGRLDIDLIGEGRGKYITQGNYIDIEWIKKSRSGKTLYYDLEGNEIIFNPGNTWIQVVDLNPNIIIK